MKYSVSSYSFLSYVRAFGATDAELIVKAKEMGFDGIEFAGINPADGSDRLTYAKMLAKTAKQNGIEIVAYCIGSNFLDGVDEQIEMLKGEVDVAAALGVGLMRHDASCGYKKEMRSQRGFNNALPDIIKGYAAVTEYAKTKGIRTMIENHGLFCQDSVRVEAIINGVADDNFGALVDIGNFLCADEDPAVAVGNVAPYAFHVHAKDFYIKKGTEFIPPDGFFMTRGGNFLKGAAIGHGCVPVMQCLRILKKAGFDGYVTVEFEGAEDALYGISCGLNSLKKIEKLLNDE